MASINEKLRYLTSAIQQLLNNAKNIGELDEVSETDTDQDLYAAIFIASSKITKRVNLRDYFNQEVGNIPNHTHTYSEVSGIGDYKDMATQDSNTNIWKVTRLMSDETNDAFKTGDWIEGF